MGASAPSSTTSRVLTPASGSPPSPGRRSPSARVLSVISDSVLPYRSTGWCPVSCARRSNTGTGNGALPDTSSRADRSASAAAASATTRDQPSAPRSTACRPPPRSPRACGRRCGRAGCRSAASPSRPSTSPCTWNSGSPCTSTSSGVHAHASASASMSAASARRLSSTPLGGPVVPEVYITRPVASGDGSGYRCHDRACNRTGTCGNPSGSSGCSPSHACARESVRM